MITTPLAAIEMSTSPNPDPRSLSRYFCLRRRFELATDSLRHHYWAKTRRLDQTRHT